MWKIALYDNATICTCTIRVESDLGGEVDNSHYIVHELFSSHIGYHSNMDLLIHIFHPHEASLNDFF